MTARKPAGATVAKFAASIALIALFCFVPVILLYQNIGSATGAQSLTDPAGLSPPTSDNDYGDATLLFGNSDSDVCIAFEFLGLDEASSQANFGIAVSATDPGSTVIQDDIDEGYTQPLLLISSNFGLSSIGIKVPSSYLQSPGASPNCSESRPEPYLRGNGYRVPQSIFVLGQPRAFPDDWYELDDTVTMYMCSATQTEDQCVTGLNLNGQVTTSSPPSLTESLIATTRDQDLRMTVSRNRATTGTNQAEPDFQFTLQRSGWFVAYTYIIAVMPFVLMIGLFIAYARKKNDYEPERKVPAVYEIAFGVAATLVAILPLRAVLIPSSLPGLTTLDTVFSTGIALLVALSLAWVFIWKSHVPPAPAPKPTSPETPETPRISP
jgi:hypothetical protein